MTKGKMWAALFTSLIIGGIGTAISQGLVPDGWMPFAQSLTVLATTLGTTVGVYQTNNFPKDLPPPKHLPAS